jgi:tetratricopeptide (TPR) repeat protein
MRFRFAAGILLVLAVWFTALGPAPVVRAEDPPQSNQELSQNRYQLGVMYEQAGDITRAMEYYRQALELWADNTLARDALQRLLDSQKTPEPFWNTLLQWLPGFGAISAGTLVGTVIWGVAALILLFVFVRLFLETIRLSIKRARGIPLLALGDIQDPLSRVPGLLHQLATDMNDAGLTIYDEKGAVLPDFSFVGDTGFAQAKLLIRLLELINARQVQRINVAITEETGLLNAAVSLVDSANSYVRFLHVVQIDPGNYKGPGELTKVMALLVADAILIALSKDFNTRGLLAQRMGDWASALKEFQAAADDAKKKGKCGELYQAFLNLGNLYSFLGLQDKSVAAYQEVGEKAQNPKTVALIQAAMACSYKNWELTSPPDQQGTYDWLAQQAASKALGSGQKTALVCYTLACYYSLCEEIEQCLVWLREAVAGDLAYLDYAMTDPDMENLRKWLNGRQLGGALGMRVG